MNSETYRPRSGVATRQIVRCCHVHLFEDFQIAHVRFEDVSFKDFRFEDLRFKMVRLQGVRFEIFGVDNVRVEDLRLERAYQAPTPPLSQ